MSDHDEEDNTFLRVVSVQSSRDHQSSVMVDLNNCPVCLKIDTGVDVNILKKSMFDKLAPKPKLESTKLARRGVNGKIQYDGVFMTDIVHKQKSYHVKTYIVKNCTNNLPSGPTASAMGLVVCVWVRYILAFLQTWDTCGAAQ